LSTGLSGWD